MQKMMLNLIVALKIIIYSTKHTQNTKLYFQKYNFKINPYSANFRHSFESECSTYFHGPPLAGLLILYIHIVIVVCLPTSQRGAKCQEVSSGKPYCGLKADVFSVAASSFSLTPPSSPFLCFYTSDTRVTT